MHRLMQFLKNNTLQGSVATPVMCGETNRSQFRKTA